MQSIYEKSQAGRRAVRLPPCDVPVPALIPAALRRAQAAALPELPEIEVVRHFTNLAQRNFSVDTHCYPLGSCTMKYNPKACAAAAAGKGFQGLHPLWPQVGGCGLTQGALELLHATERLLSELTGMAEFTLQPLAGAQGEFTGAMLIAAYQRARGNAKKQILIPDSAHGTNPASAALAGFEVLAVPSTPAGTVDVAKLRSIVNAATAGMMLTNPNTLGLFEPEVRAIAEIIHAADGLLYYDGANFNAILGRVKPAEMGFDICHLNLHKTFSAPHGGGGPGSGPVGVVERLRPYLPVPRVVESASGWALDYDQPHTIGQVAPFYGNFGVLVWTYAYGLLLGSDGLRTISDHAVLNANYIQEKLRAHYQPVTEGRCMHECVLSAQPLLAHGIRALDIAKGLIERGFHPPTVYFPLIVPEALMVEPTETETRETLDRFIAAMADLARLAQERPQELQAAPRTTPVGRLDEVAAARNMRLVLEEEGLKAAR